MNMPTVAEIVTFRLNTGVNPEDFAAVAAAMTPFLRSTGAMISRTLSADDAGLWTEHITWTSEKAAKEAAEAMFAQPEAKPFMEMIAQEDTLMRYAKITLYLPPE